MKLKCDLYNISQFLFKPKNLGYFEAIFQPCCCCICARWTVVTKPSRHCVLTHQTAALFCVKWRPAAARLEMRRQIENPTASIDA